MNLKFCKLFIIFAFFPALPKYDNTVVTIRRH